MVAVAPVVELCTVCFTAVEWFHRFYSRVHGCELRFLARHPAEPPQLRASCKLFVTGIMTLRALEYIVKSIRNKQQSHLSSGFLLHSEKCLKCTTAIKPGIRQKTS